MSDELLTELIQTEEDAQRVFKTQPDLRSEFKSATTLWHYVEATRRGSAKIISRRCVV